MITSGRYAPKYIFVKIRAYRVIHQHISRGLAVFAAGAWVSGWLAEISADLQEAVAYEVCRTRLFVCWPSSLELATR